MRIVRGAAGGRRPAATGRVARVGRRQPLHPTPTTAQASAFPSTQPACATTAKARASAFPSKHSACATAANARALASPSMRLPGAPADMSTGVSFTIQTFRLRHRSKGTGASLALDAAPGRSGRQQHGRQPHPQSGFPTSITCHKPHPITSPSVRPRTPAHPPPISTAPSSSLPQTNPRLICTRTSRSPAPIHQTRRCNLPGPSFHSSAPPLPGPGRRRSTTSPG